MWTRFLRWMARYALTSLGLETFGLDKLDKAPERPAPQHPAAGRFCHICGADSLKKEPCDGGLHS